MSYSSFIFYIDEEPYGCGCYHDCSCPRYSHDLTHSTSVNDAVNYLVNKIKYRTIQYVDRIFVNGVFVNNARCVIERGGKLTFVNPINLDPAMIKNHIGDEVPKAVGLKAATLLHSVFEAVSQSQIVIDHITEYNGKAEAAAAKRKAEQAERDKKELERLKKMYPDT